MGSEMCIRDSRLSILTYLPIKLRYPLPTVTIKELPSKIEVVLSSGEVVPRFFLGVVTGSVIIGSLIAIMACISSLNGRKTVIGLMAMASATIKHPQLVPMYNLSSWTTMEAI